MWEENQNIIDIVEKKNLPILIKDGEGKTEIGGEKIDSEKKNLDEIKYCLVFSKVKLPSMLTACKLPGALLK